MSPINGLPLTHDLRTAFPATWENLLHLKNLIQEHDPESTVFPADIG
jgi:hypothetical protein